MANIFSKMHSTIGLLITIADNTLYSNALDVACEHGANLIAFVGGCLQDPRPFRARANVIYDLVNPDNVDGLIAKTSSLSNYIGQESVQHFCEKYHPLPIVSVGIALPGIPSVVLDDYQGMRSALAHLIEVHGFHRVAFIRGTQGHPGAEARYRAYMDMIQEYGFDFDPDLVSPCHDWSIQGGERAINVLLDERNMRFDALLCSSDRQAFGAMIALQARGIRVPDDIAVVGFGDYQIAQAASPPLTTVRLPTHERGRRATEMLLDIFAGKSVPECVRLPTTLIVRQSCGCLKPRDGQTAIASQRFNASSLRDVLLGPQREHILQEMTEQAGLPKVVRIWASQLLDAFYAELDGGSSYGTSDTFLAVLERAMKENLPASSGASCWQGAISVLRTHTLPFLHSDSRLLAHAEHLWEQARVRIGEWAQQMHARQVWQAEQWVDTLLKISQVLTTVNSLPEMMNVLAQELPGMGIPGCYLSLYEDPERPTECARLHLAYNRMGRINLGAEGQRFPARQLVPDGLLPKAEYTLVVEPLYFQDKQLGFVVFEAEPGRGLEYDVLSQQISSALAAVLLLIERAQLYQQAVQAQKEAEKANDLKSRFLSVVSHELLTPLSLITGLSEILLRKTSKNDLPLPEPYRQDLARIHTSAQQLHGLIRDVLDLARGQVGQLRLVKKPLKLSEVIHAVSLVGERMAKEKGLTWRVEIPAELPLVLGDRTRLQQVMLNLVSNAIKFTDRGEVGLTAKTHQGQVILEIYDTGLGVPLDEQEAIFDEFRQSKRTEARGYSGLGIGLALCRQLVELHGGAIGVRSSGEEGAGSTFFFTLPAMPAEALEASEQEERHSQVLLLLTRHVSEGKRLVEHLMQVGLESRIVNVAEMPNWFPQVLTSPPGAIVLDFDPATEQCWKLIEALRQHPATEDIPVLFYSLLEDEDRGSVLALDYLTKPLDSASLVQALERHGLVPAEDVGKKTILVVDDDPYILDMQARLIQTHLPHCRVLKATTGREALAVIKQEHLDLVLLDLGMPELDGFGVLEAMREHEQICQVPVIVLTARSLSEMDMARLNQGVAAVLKKGMFSTEETMTQVTETLMRSKRLRSESQWLMRKAMAYIHEHLKTFHARILPNISMLARIISPVVFARKQV
ncbi:MAG: substrate-binding domain-containing protein [Anaerolineae bacterium]